MSIPPIHFVISAPRSGSTWLTNALNVHPEIFATEHRLFGGFAEIWKNNNGTTSPRLTFDTFAKAFSTHYFHDELGLNHLEFKREFQTSFIEFVTEFGLKRKSSARIVIDKITPYPGTAHEVTKQINDLCPHSKIIQLVRDGRDVVTSGTFDWLLKDAAGTARHDYFIENRRDTKLTRFFDDEVIEKWAANWRESIEIFSDQPADIQVTYELMKADLGAELYKVFSVLGASDSSKIADEAVAKTKFELVTGRNAGTESPTSKARKGIVGDWKNYFTRADAECFHKHAGDLLISNGYEKDNSWIETCPEELVLVNN